MKLGGIQKFRVVLFAAGLFYSGLAFFNVNAYASSGSEGASFLDIPVGAGPAALGSAYTALANDAYAPIYNPAGLGFLSSTQLTAQHLSFLQSMNYEFGSFVIPLGHSQDDDKPTKALGTSIQYLGSGDIAGTDPAGNPIGSFTTNYTAYSLAYGQKLTDKLSLGLTGKAINAKIADVSATAYAADLGSLYQVTDNLKLAATYTNLGSKLTFSSQDDSLPEAFHLGAAYQIQNHLRTTLEGVYSKTGLVSGRFGAEWTPIEAISLRAGYRTDTTNQLSAMAGMTVGLGVHVFGQEFSYAWLPYGDLGDTQYFSLLLKFGDKEEEKRNLIQYQSIKTHRTASGHGEDQPEDLKQNDPDYQQLMQLLSDESKEIATKSSER